MVAKLLKAVAYYRRSTKDQEGSITDQRTAVKEYAFRRGYTIIDEYVDDGISGDETEKRHAFLKMRDDTASGTFQFVLCWDQDRFGRFDSLDAGYWIYPFRQNGVQLVTLTDEVVKWDDYTGRMMYSITQEAKHNFLRDLSRNVLRGQVEAAKKGSWIGTAPYAYRIVGEKKNKRLEIADEEKAAVVRRIFSEFVDDRRSMSAIARRLTEDGILSSGGREMWRGCAVKVILENPAYVGTFRYNSRSYSKYHTYRNGEITPVGHHGQNDEAHWIVIPDVHPAIIDQATFDRAQAILAKGKTGRPPRAPEDNPYLLSGLLRCGRCGSPLWGMDSRKYRYYECSRRKYHKDCEGTTVREDFVLDLLVTYIDTEFIPSGVQTELLEKASRNELTEQDLPEAFKKLKQMLVGPAQRRVDKGSVNKRIKSVEGKLHTARRNLSYIAREFIETVQDEIRSL